MKKVLVVILVLFLSSCIKFYKVDHTTKGKIISKDYVESKTEYSFHYGWSLGKYKYHYGPETTPEKWIVNIEFLGQVGALESKDYFENLPDTFEVVYTDVFKIVNGDTTLSVRKIKDIKWK